MIMALVSVAPLARSLSLSLFLFLSLSLSLSLLHLHVTVSHCGAAPFGLDPFLEWNYVTHKSFGGFHTRRGHWASILLSIHSSVFLPVESVCLEGES